MLPAHVAAFRAQHRAAHIGSSYSGWGHLALTSAVALLVIVLALRRTADIRGAEWLALPLSFLFANLGEYLGHRGPMHRPRRGLALVYQRHTLQHHRFYTHEAMAAESARDFQMVLFPPLMLLFFFGGMAAPLGVLLFALTSANVAWLFVATATGYFLTYEWLHLAYHLDPDSRIGRLRLLRRLRRHHTLHHDPRLMGRWNFNITFPISDMLFGTRRLPSVTEKAR